MSQASLTFPALVLIPLHQDCPHLQDHPYPAAVPLPGSLFCWGTSSGAESFQQMGAEIILTLALPNNFDLSQ